MDTVITDVRVFDGEDVTPTTTVTVRDGRIDGVGPAPVGLLAAPTTEVVDGRGRTLLPGLIDAHVHTSPDSLRLALTFGVTTELEMGGFSSRADRDEWDARDDLASIRSAGHPVTAPGGHPSQLFVDHAGPDAPRPDDFPQTATPDDAHRLVDRLAATGSDYVKFILEEGSVLGSPGLPELDHDAFAAGVTTAHEHGLLALTHAMTVSTTERAVRAGADGVVHLFIDRPHSAELIDGIAGRGTFVTPCLSLVSSLMGRPAERLAADPRVAGKLPPAWAETLPGSMAVFTDGRFDDALASTRALADAGVDILAGTDVAIPTPHLAGLAHGASLHHELALLVDAGLSPVQALRAATSVPARRFGLDDRGRIAPGLRADLVLVDGDPTTTVTDTLSVARVWRGGVPVAGIDV